MKQENHLWTTALAPDATHHAHDLKGATWRNRFLIASFTGVSLQNMVRATVYLWISAVWLNAHHFMHISSSAWHCTRTSSTFLWSGVHHITFLLTDKTWCWSSYIYPWLKKDLRNIKERTVESGKRGERTMNNIEEFVYALYSFLLEYAFVDAHDLIRSTWCRRIWNHAL